MTEEELNNDYTFFQSCVIPYRIADGKLEILLITSLRKKKWIVPKGFVEFNLSAFESAKKEAFEEAGVIGANETVELGEYRFEKGEGITMMKVYSMEVTKELDSYPEMNLRKRKWFGISIALEKLEMPELKGYLNKLQKMVGHS